jgi:hypothetical protein
MTPDVDLFVQRLRLVEATTVTDVVPAGPEVATWVRARLAETRAREPDVELVLKVPRDPLARVFVLLCQRYGIDVYRPSKSRSFDGRVMIRVPESFEREVLRPLVEAVTNAVEAHLAEVTKHVMRVAFDLDVSPVPPRRG